ncbi:PP2C family protein-serine/threonine phosphatase [Algivirga pacifica]|uniref:PPM-type phosphatase domain-containing protein n=1 Tax=Algivirga pacifica TaxID=1162670 RepID=A0ABP9DGL8_9BACT
MQPSKITVFQRRVLYFSSIANALFATSAALLAFFILFDKQVTWMFGVDALINFILAYFTVKRPGYRVALLSFLNNALFLLYAWYAFGNIHNLANMVALVLVAQARIMLNDKPGIVTKVSIVFGSLLMLLHVGAILFPTYIVVARPEMLLFDMAFISVAYSFISFTLKKYSDQVQEEQSTVQEQKEEMATQNEELRVTNEELTTTREEIMSQREELARQHQELQRTNNNLLLSINYANRIQKALFNSSRNILKGKDSFLLDIPKDIVSGDFCFVRELNGITYIAQGDCTGHGVPGAILTVIASEILDRIIVEKKSWSPKEILTFLDAEMNYRLKEEGKTNLDGLEAGILAIDSKMDVALFAGAKRPLIHWDSEKKTYNIIRGTKKAVGNAQNVENQYKENIFRIQKGDRFYLFTDGYVDQFGGEDNKKYSSKRFYRTISELSDIKISEQAQVLLGEFEEWKGNKKQIDDVMVLGIEV